MKKSVLIIDPKDHLKDEAAAGTAELSDDAGGAMQVEKVSQEDADGVCKQLAQEFVQAKVGKLNRLSRLYLWLHKHFVEQIMF